MFEKKMGKFEHVYKKRVLSCLFVMTIWAAHIQMMIMMIWDEPRPLYHHHSQKNEMNEKKIQTSILK